MEETTQEVLFETRRHASRPYTSNDHPPQQLKGGGGGSLLSYLPFRGITQLKDKYSKYRQPRRLKRLVFLFVSARGDYVAVASGNQITILKKDDEYKEPVGTFTCGSTGTFTCGTWSEFHELIGVADDSDTIYIVKPNGQEMTRITKKHLNASSPIVGLVVQDDASEKKPYLCTFTVIVSDGSFYDIEISKDPSASIVSTQALSRSSMLRKFPLEICCWDYHPKLSLFAIVTIIGDIRSSSNGTIGSCSVSIWRNPIIQTEPVASVNFEGSYFIPKEYHCRLTSPKVLFSQYGNYVASLDREGCLIIFQFDEKTCSFSRLSREVDFLHDIGDFTWWSDNILTVAKRNGTVIMVDIVSYVIVSDNDLAYSMPLLERAKQSPGLVFILENTLSEDDRRPTEREALIERVARARPDQFDFSKMGWSLVSLVKRSSLEIYDNLISNQRYRAALDFADRHGLDKDEALKSQWLSSGQGVHEINDILSIIKDQKFVLFECLDKVGPTEDAARALLSFGLCLTDSYRFSEFEENENRQKIWNFRLARLKLLQFRDKLETFLGVNMGRFCVQEYSRFRELPIGKAALVLAESGKIGALNLLFKRHLYSLIPSILEVLAAIPETIPVQSYVHLLPGVSAPSTIIFRDDDWVECEMTVTFLNNFYEDHEGSIPYMTEPIMKHMKIQWPSISELSFWYKKRARDIDTLSGQLDNCMRLIELAIHKGISDLQKFFDDIFYLNQLIYSDEMEDEMNFSMSLTTWVQLPDYEKFKLIMMGVKEDNVIPRLRKKAIPFMERKLYAPSEDDATDGYFTKDKTVDSYTVRWMKEIATQNKLVMCSIIIEEGYKDMANNHFFKDEVELVDCALQCMYFCTDVDSWSTMSAILSKLAPLRGFEAEGIKERFKLAVGHVEAGRLLTYYQVPKPISFFLDARSDDKGVKQILRLLLSKFIRSQPGRTDHDWANMWRDLLSLQEKAFPFLDLEYMLIEFCRGLLKAGKFTLARNYLKGTSSVTLATDKAENLVIQAAREYFFSAPILTSSEVWKAKECLNIFLNSRNVRAESDIIDAVTVRLPNLGVHLLPMEFRQIKDPMEIIKLAITSQTGAYLNVDELIEIAKLLGLSSNEEISTVQEAIAREAAFAGDVQLAFDLCLELAKKGHGSIWDLCAALARSQAVESMDSKSQKMLLGFALIHCDEESISEILHEWKDVDTQDQCETMITSAGESFEFSEPVEFSGTIKLGLDDQETQLTKAKSALSLVARNLSSENGYDWESLLKGKGDVVSFAASELPWLLKSSEDREFGKTLTSSVPTCQHVSLRTRAVMTILSWLTRSGFAPRDDLIASLAKSIMEPPVSDVEDIIGCSVLLNLVDAFYGAEIIEEQLKIRGNYFEFSSLMNVGMIYSLLHNYGVECENPAERRKLLLNKLRGKQKLLNSDECNIVHEAQSTFWNEWKVKLEQQKIVADKSRALEKLIPGVETSRFFSGDMEYIQSVIFFLIDSVKVNNKSILKDTLVLAQTYGLNSSKVLLYYLSTILVSEVWSVDDISEEILDMKEEILACAREVIKSISSSVYPAINGHDKQRLGVLYNLLSDCYMHLQESRELENADGLARFCKIVGQECSRVSFIKGLDFKNVAGLRDLNLNCFNDEIRAQIDENNVESLAFMVQNLLLVYGDTVPDCLISWNYIYTHYVLSSLLTLEGKAERETQFRSSEEINSFVDEIERTYEVCKKYIRFIEHPSVSEVLLRFFTIVLPIDKSVKNFPCDSTGKNCLVKLLNFWLGLMNDTNELVSLNILAEKIYSELLMIFFDIFRDLLVGDIVSPNQGWCTVVNYMTCGLKSNVATETLKICRAMIFSGCGFKPIFHVFSEIPRRVPPGSSSSSTTTTDETSINIRDLPNVYLSILENLLQELARGSHDRQNLQYLLSSLSKTEGNFEDLTKVRLSVWERMSRFCDDSRLASHVRVYALELMQCISGRKRNLQVSSPDDDVAAYLRPWDGWDDVEGRNVNRENTADDPTAKDAPSRFTSTLVALKSSRLVSSISTNLEITPDDISSLDSASSCFLRISEFVTTGLHVDALISVLAEWEGFFSTGVPENDPDEITWSNDDWGEGWESFQDESAEKVLSNDENTLPVHPLHICWTEVIKKLAIFSRYIDVLKLLDEKNRDQNCRVLLDEDDTRSVSRILSDSDRFLAFKFALMLPYEGVRSECLDAVENELKEKGVPDEIAPDHFFFFVLVLSSGILSKIVTDANHGTTFSYICYMVGNLCRGSREEKKESLDFLFVRVLFPCFIAELVRADQHVLAGFLVTKFMHTHASLSLINIAAASLRRYLEGHFRELQERESLEGMCFCEPLLNTVTSLRGKMGNLIQSAISLLPTDVR